MIFTRNKFCRVLTFTLALVVLSSMVWIQASVSPVAAQAPETEETVLSILIIPEGEKFSIASVGTPPVFEVGDIFKVSIVALGVTDPGIFGSQFELTYDTSHLAAVDGSLASGLAMEPVVIARSLIDPAEGLVAYAASRQGDIDNLSGNVVLATLRFEAVGPTGPPEGQTTVIHLQNVKLGAKGGIEVPVGGLVDLEVIIVDSNVPGQGDIAGKVTVEGRAADNQADHTITAVNSASEILTSTTDANGDFLINNAPADTYTLTADSPGFLAATCAEVAHSAETLTSLTDVVLLAGDIDDNSEIDITDAVAIGTVFGSTTLGEVADLNADSVVDILDLILMAANFGQTSVDNVWTCQLPVEL